MHEKTVLHIDMNAFFASVEQRMNPHLRGLPVLVCGNPRGRTTVAAASYEARPYGVRSGMPLGEALSLCPDAVLVEGSPIKYVETARTVFDILRGYSPLMEVYSIDEAFVDLSAGYRAWPRPEAAAVHMKNRIREELGLTCSVGIGPNKMLAKLASGMQKPDGLVRITAADVPALFETLSVTELCGIGQKTARYLERLGIFTCADLGRADEGELARRFGVVGRALSLMGKGCYDDPVLPYSHEVPVKSMGHCHTLQSDTRSPAVIRSHIFRLSEQVGRRLRRDDYRGRTVSLILRSADFTTLSRQRTIDSHTDDGYVIAWEAMRILGRIYDGRTYVRMIGVSLSGLLRGREQLALLEEDRRRGRLTRAIDAVNDKYGEFTIKRAVIGSERCESGVVSFGAARRH